ncbi:MAG TPA: hypothetical protein VGR53_06955 [Nitrososphaerales archaeon]|nr:hypothetical protein [Nitrososphaerales archaeon]
MVEKQLFSKEEVERLVRSLSGSGLETEVGAVATPVALAAASGLSGIALGAEAGSLAGPLGIGAGAIAGKELGKKLMPKATKRVEIHLREA